MHHRFTLRIQYFKIINAKIALVQLAKLMKQVKYHFTIVLLIIIQENLEDVFIFIIVKTLHLIKPLFILIKLKNLEVQFF